MDGIVGAWSRGLPICGDMEVDSGPNFSASLDFETWCSSEDGTLKACRRDKQSVKLRA